MKSYKIVGIPLNLLAWVLLAVTVGYSWYWFSLVQPLVSNDNFEQQIMDRAEAILLVCAVLSTLALLGLTISIAGHTFSNKPLNLSRAMLFSFEWILIAATTVLLWSIDNPDTVLDSAQLVPSITVTIALVIYTGYFIMEGYHINDEPEKKTRKRKHST